MCKILHGLTPPYLSEDCQLVTDMGRRHLRSANVHTCAVLRTQTRLGDRCFAVAGPRLWNNLPFELRQRDICLREFRRLLKTFLFCWDSAPYDFLFKCAVYKYTYLHTYLFITYLFQLLTYLLTYSRAPSIVDKARLLTVSETKPDWGMFPKGSPKESGYLLVVFPMTSRDRMTSSWWRHDFSLKCLFSDNSCQNWTTF